MLADEIYSVYCERHFRGLACITIEIRADLFDELLHEISDVYPVFREPYMIYGMEINSVSTTEDYRFMIMD